MTRWFRHYAGMMRDEKLVRCAVKAKQPVERVVWVWGAILESAAEINDGGRYEFDAGEVAYFLRCDESDITGIVGGLEGSGRLTSGVVARWGDRQFSSDAAAERQRRYRARKSGSDVPEGDNHHNGDAQGDVTRPSRDARVTPQETETNTDTEVVPPNGGVPGVDEALSAYEGMAKASGLAVPRIVNQARRAKLASILRLHGADVWAEAVRRVGASEFCLGQNDRGWRADLDFLLQPKTFTRVLEGHYDNRQRAGPAPRRKPDPVRELLTNLRTDMEAADAGPDTQDERFGTVVGLLPANQRH